MLDDYEIEAFCVGMQMGKTFQNKQNQDEIKWLLENDVLMSRDKKRAEYLKEMWENGQ